MKKFLKKCFRPTCKEIVEPVWPVFWCIHHYSMHQLHSANKIQTIQFAMWKNTIFNVHKYSLQCEQIQFKILTNTIWIVYKKWKGGSYDQFSGACTIALCTNTNNQSASFYTTKKHKCLNRITHTREINRFFCTTSKWATHDLPDIDAGVFSPPFFLDFPPNLGIFRPF